MTRREANRSVALLLLATLGGMWDFSTCAAEPAIPVTLQLLWTHQAYFGGFYVAEQKQLYAAEGLQIRYLEGGPQVDLIAPVIDGRAQFGIAAAGELLAARANGKPVRAIATIFRRSPAVYVARAESGIRAPADFVGKTIRVSTVDAASLAALMSKAEIAPDQYRLINLPSDVELFAAGKADVWAVYVNNFAIVLERAGHKLNYIYPDDYGVHFYADTIFTTDDLIATKPDLILRFLRASLKGWSIAVEDPGMVGAMMRLYSPDADPELETLKMRATQALVNTGEDEIGWMRPERWSEMAATLQEQGIITAPLNASDVFTLQFLQEVYGAKQ